jgi:drug/metabolite transporter (DMT)-like permease
MRPIGRVLGAAVAFGAVSVLARRAYQAGSEPTSLLGVRLVVAALVLSMIALPQRSRVARGELWWCTIAGLAFAGAGLGEFEALSHATAATVVLLVFVAPVWIALVYGFLGLERLGWRQAAVLAGLLTGIALLVGTPGGHSPSGPAVVLGLGASVAAAVFFLSLDQVGRETRPRVAACIAAWIAAIVVVPLDPAGLSRELLRVETAIFGVLAGLLTGCGLALLASGVRQASALTASGVICAEPVVAAVLSWLLLGEVLTGAQLAGGAVVMVSVSLLSAVSARVPPELDATGRTRRPQRGSRPPPRPARSARHRR